MSVLRYALPALGLASTAIAQCGRAGTTTTINAAAEITACSTYTGSVALATGAAAIDFGALEGITEDLVAMNSTVTTLAGNSLKAIGGRFALFSTHSLSSISFDQLTNIGSVDWENVPQLATLSFRTGVQQIDNFTMVDSQIQDLSNVNLKTANTIVLSSNRRLQGLTWQTSEISGALTLDSNGESGSGFVAHFPSLTTAGQIVINSVSSLDFSSLVNATQLSITDTSVSNLTFPNLTNVGAVGIAIVNNAELTELSFPALQGIAGPLAIVGNDALTGNLSFPKLKQCANLDAEGAFSSLSLPVINTISGAVVVSTTSDSFDCGDIQALSPGVTNTTPNCTAGATDTGSSGNGGTGTSGGSSASSSTGAASRVDLGTATLFGATGLLAAMFGVM